MINSFPHASRSKAARAEDRFYQTHGSAGAVVIFRMVEACGDVIRYLTRRLRKPQKPLVLAATTPQPAPK